MSLLQSKFLLFLLIIGYIQQINSQCAAPFMSDNVTNLCYYYRRTPLSWSDAYHQCLNKNVNGLLIQIFTLENFIKLTDANIGGKGPFWIGANNFGFFSDSHWHWLDGSIVLDSVITWCSNSTYDVAIGAYCAAYDNTQKCVTNYLCNTSLPAPCVIVNNSISKQTKNIIDSRTSSTVLCTNSYGGAYANWWTYSTLLLNCKKIVILTISIVILSFMMIIAFSILWGVQYQDILQLPLILVSLGSLASILFLIDILILVSNRIRVQKWLTSMIVTIITIIVECILMLGIVLCMAHCSSYISLISTHIDKDVIASLLSGMVTALTIICVHIILFLIGVQGQERINAVAPNRTNPNNPTTITTRQTLVPRTIPNTNGTTSVLPAKRHNRVDRATSPVDERIINEFYSDHSKDMHQYHLEGRQYVVYEGLHLMNIETDRKELTQAMLLQETQGLNEAIARAKNSIHAAALAEEIHQAENLVNRLK